MSISKLISKIVRRCTNVNLFVNFMFKIKLKIFNKKQIIIACYPKSASTYLTHLLSDATGFNKTFWKKNTGASQNFLYLPLIVDDLSRNNIVQQHFKYNHANAFLLDSLNAKVVVLTRNIYDVVISLIDHIDQSNKSPIEDESLAFFPKLSTEEKIDYVISYIVPWYIGFYASWYNAKKDNKVDVCFSTFDEVVDTPIVVVDKILKFYKINSSIVSNNESSKDKKINFNSGKKGRGDEYLTAEHKIKIKSLTSCYTDIDFSIIGIK